MGAFKTPAFSDEVPLSPSHRAHRLAQLAQSRAQNVHSRVLEARRMAVAGPGKASEDRRIAILARGTALLAFGTALLVQRVSRVPLKGRIPKQKTVSKVKSCQTSAQSLY